MSSPRPEEGTSAGTTNVNYPPPSTTPTASAETSRPAWVPLILRSSTYIVMFYDIILLITSYNRKILFPSLCVLSSLAACCLVAMIAYALHNHIRENPITHGAEWHFSLWVFYTTCVASAVICLHVRDETHIFLAILSTPLIVAFAVLLFIGISNLCTGFTYRQNEVYILLVDLFPASKKLPAVRAFLSDLQTVTDSFSRLPRMWPRLHSPTPLHFDCDDDLEVKKGPMDFV